MIKCWSEKVERDFLGNQWLRFCLKSLVREPRSRASWSKHQNIRWNNTVTNLLKTLKMVHIFKNRDYFVNKEKSEIEDWWKVNIPSVWETLTWKATIHFLCLWSRNICDDSHCDWCWRSKCPQWDVGVQESCPRRQAPFAQHVYNQQWDWGHYHGGSWTNREVSQPKSVLICL